MLPPNEIEALAQRDALLAAGVQYAYRDGDVLVTFRRAPAEVARGLARAALRNPPDERAPAAAPPLTIA